MAKKKDRKKPNKIVNRKARHEYHIHETIEAGLVLTGSEVKSLREGRVQLHDAFVRINDTQATLYGCQIDRYPPATDRNHDPQRSRRLLLHRREIRKLALALNQSGVTIVPLSIYFNSRGIAKIELAIATGKKQRDKREDMRKKEHQRDMERAMSRRR